VKSVAGLMNARGGILLVGVADDGKVIGIEQDLKMLPRRQDIDEYTNHLTTLLGQAIGAAAVANVHVTFEEVIDQTVCRIAVSPSSTRCGRSRRAKKRCSSSGSTIPLDHSGRARRTSTSASTSDDCHDDHVPQG